MSYLLYNGHRVPFRYIIMREGKIFFVFYIHLPGEATWPPARFLPVYGDDDTLIFRIPTEVPGSYTRDGSLCVEVPMDINSVEEPK